MSDPVSWIIHTDGAARGNPGPAAFAYVIERPGESAIEGSGCLGETTNNVAEYTALIRALEHAHRLGGRRIQVHSDSELMVKQMQGAYKVKHPGLQPLYQQAKKEADRFENVTYQHVRREANKRADELCNNALDGPDRAVKSSSGGRRSKKATALSDVKVEAIHAQAVECLQTAAAAWACGNAHDPPPEAVWEQLWDILREEGLVK
jgi:ribonuclease HI